MNCIEEDDARGVVEALLAVEIRKAGRDFLYTVTRTDGSAVTGRVVEQGVKALTLVIEGPPNEHREVAWGDIQRIAVEAAD